MSIFIKKPIALLQQEAAQSGAGTLRRVLGPVSLIAIGIGTIVGAGLFSITGLVAANNAGPAIMLSFVIASVCCCFAGLCYAEFASMIPIAGSAYTYSYATMGELMAWIIGWDLVLEYSVAATTVSVSWSRYLTVFLGDVGIEVPPALTACPWEGGIINLPALLIVVFLSLLLIRGTKESATFNMVIVLLKVGVIITFVILGWRYINADNYTPFIPQNTGRMGEFGISGVLRGAGIVFFAYLGFDVVSTTAQETKNPRRNMPIGILGSLIVVLILYLLFAHVMTGVANYKMFSGKEGIAPVAVAISQMGTADAAGVVHPAYPWLNKAILLAILVGYCSVIMGTLMAQSRIFLSMSHDGMLPKFFSKIHPRFRTPAHNSALLMVCVGLLAAFVPAGVAGEMVSIGTLFAFILVCAGVMVMRRTMPEQERAFRVPLVPLIPMLGILSCLIVAFSLPADTWIRLVVWMLIGFDIYYHYGYRRSRLEQSANAASATKNQSTQSGQSAASAQSSQSPTREGIRTLYVLGVIVSVACFFTGLWHQASAGWESSKVLLVVALVFGAFHLIYYGLKLVRSFRTAV